eukprot:CCRYP_013701-RA/>CCRYP_013701-RA protein AED:0.35 eAED:0.46 QI:0/0/0/1/1/1/2/0/422
MPPANSIAHRPKPKSSSTSPTALPKSCHPSSTTSWASGNSMTTTAEWSSTRLPSLSLPTTAPLFSKAGVNNTAPSCGGSLSSPTNRSRPTGHPKPPWLSMPVISPDLGALVHYLHAAAGFLVKATWLAAIKAGNYASWPGLTHANASKYCPSCDEAIKGHLTQVRQGIRSTKPKPPKTTAPMIPSLIPPAASKELHLWDEPISKLFTDDMGRFPVQSCSGNQYLMLAYHCDPNAILVEPFQSRHDRHRIPAYNKLMARAHTVDHQVLDNEASAEYRRVITEDWNCSYQLVPPNVHRRNIAKCAIQTFKVHFLSILAGLPSAFPNYLWDMLIPQTELTLNLLRQSHTARAISAWEAYNNAPFNFDATPIGPCGCPIIIHNKPNKRLSWAFRGRDRFRIGLVSNTTAASKYLTPSQRLSSSRTQ